MSVKDERGNDLHFLTPPPTDEAKRRLAELVRCASNRRADCVKGWRRVSLEEFGNLETAVEETESAFAGHILRK
jgi:hypothetical protein